ncbi:ergothioneine biosynthesis protein EgtB, partial [Bacillus tequilensis]|nr:ergothioneine biosynthesis protein EgtB [Bacillus tequilensis]
PQYAYLFNSYYNNLGSRVLRHQRSTITRPPLRQVLAYRKYVDAHMHQLLQELPEEKSAEIRPLLELGLQHEQQHQELLLTDIKYILGTNPLLPAYQPLPAQLQPPAAAPPARYLEVPGGKYTIGYQGNGFCFDNELGVHEVLLEDFGIMNRLVTNGEYLEFIQDGGYSNFRHWLDEGWTMV